MNETLNWKSVRDEIVAETDKIWLEETPELRKIRVGLTDSGAGSAGQYFSTLVHLEAYTLMLGQHLLYSALKFADEPNMELATLISITHESTGGTFDSFEFLGDLGLQTLHRLGEKYLQVLPTLDDKEQFKELTGVMLTYATRCHRWMHLYFPWGLGVVFPKPYGGVSIGVDGNAA